MEVFTELKDLFKNWPLDKPQNDEQYFICFVTLAFSIAAIMVAKL